MKIGNFQKSGGLVVWWFGGLDELADEEVDL